MRRHGWQPPLHPLQIVAMAIYSFLVAAFYTFLGLFLGNRTAEIAITTLFSFVAISAMFLFVRCVAIDPTDKISVRKKKKMKSKSKSKSKSNLNYGLILGEIVSRQFRSMERKILKTFIRRKYLDPWKVRPQMEPLIPFPLVMKDDVVTSDHNEEDLTFCSLCNFEVKRHSKHCRTCNRCVEGFDHHCRWLNNCVGKKNYTTFFLLMISVMLMLAIEGGASIAIFVRCFADKRGMEMELQRRFHIEFPREVLATITVLLVLMTAYGSAALGQLFFFHVVLIQKGMRTYDYILAMKEESQFIIDDDSFDENSDFSSDDEFDLPEKKPTFVSRFITCQGGRVKEDSTQLSIKIDANPQSTSTVKQDLRISIDPWKLITLSTDKALAAAERAKERLKISNHDYLKPLPLETKSGLQNNSNTNTSNCDNIDGRGSWGNAKGELLPKAKGRVPTGSPGSFSSPRKRCSGSPTTVPAPDTTASISPKHRKYRSNFDLKLTEVSKELETYISRQVLCSIIKEESMVSPR
ncbi:protein S-acyltransferase 18-like isoform X1 [Cucurbita pepo subsp. pepo]|uniref:protein S-acyltransferase 18-like isoform X1 n=1 Tax=Cucurbita pepo subsp. pepo TaxID=3664 RepID=UPI000C9D8029|nr:protein S-acyltransferase 18-like isoform X1 [Cucurbita pepo subsp. pepo]